MTPPRWLEGDILPPPLAAMVLAGTAGRDHLRRAAAMAGHCAATAPPTAGYDWHRLRLGLLMAAFEEDTLFGPTAAELLQAIREHGGKGVDPAFTALVTTLGERFSLPESTAYFERLQAAGNVPKLRRFLENECQNGRHGLFWLHVALHQAVLCRDFDWGAACLKAAIPDADDVLAPVAAKLAGDLALLSGLPQRAMARYSAAETRAPWPQGLFRSALAALDAGEDEQTLRQCGRILTHMPEHVAAALTLFDAVSGRATATAPLPGRLGIALYTYNKAGDTDRTLASLFATGLGDARVVVLDNAATDATPEVLAAWVARVGTQRLGVIRLPVNIGAPGARNWLAADARLRDVAFVAYLDDDVDLPADWLGRLGAAVAAYPEAGVWGCRVADAGNPAVAQGIDAVLLPGEADATGRSEPRLSDAHAASFDYGAFSHMRPCLSVMGCCHLFRRERLAEAGGFDIRFSPSQYDDVDHDLRLALSGRLPVYQGHLRVAHRRPAPVFSPPHPVQEACGQANYRKLMAKHREKFPDMDAAVRNALILDLKAKWERLELAFETASPSRKGMA